MLTKNPGGMGIINKEHCVISLFYLNKPFDIRHVTVHAEKALGDNKRSAKIPSMLLKHAFKMLQVIVPIPEKCGP